MSERCRSIIDLQTNSGADVPHGLEAQADSLGRDPGPVASDDPAGLELLDPLVGGRAADPDVRSELGIGPPAVPLEQLQEPGVGSIQAALICHVTPIS